MPKVSFVLPIFNMEKYLHRCLKSIQAQTDPDFEAILVDDGSTDDTANICMEYTKSDSRFLYIYQKNAWQAAARNTGLERVCGEFVAFVDPDDYIESNYIEILYSYAKETSADIICFGYQWNRNIDDTVFVEKPKQEKIVDITSTSLIRHFCQDWLLPQRMNFVWSKLYRRQFLDGTGIKFNVATRYGEDRNFCYKLLVQSKRTVYMTEAPYFYFQHNKSTIRSMPITDNLFRIMIETYYDILDYWRKKEVVEFDLIKPVILLRMLQGAVFNTLQSIDNVPAMAEAAESAFAEFPLSEELSMEKLQKGIFAYAEICGLNWGEQSKLWLFALSLLGGKDGIVTWQELYPGYSKLLDMK